MARGKKTGGRDWKKGEGGRPKGAKDKTPRTVKASLIAIYEKLEAEKPELFERAILDGLAAKAPVSLPYLRMWAEYREGKPVERHEVTGKDGGPLVYAWED